MSTFACTKDFKEDVIVMFSQTHIRNVYKGH